MAEAVEALAIEWLLAVSYCTDGEKVVRGGSRHRSKTQRRGDEGKAAVRQPYRRRSGARSGGEARSDMHGREALRQRGGGAASDSGDSATSNTGDGSVGQPLSANAGHRGGLAGVAQHVAPGGDSALTSGLGTEREKLTCGTPRQM
jgi:hypothetical protein